MKYKVTLNGKVYEVQVERGEAIIAAEYDAMAPAAPVAAAPAPVAAAPAPAAAPAAASTAVAAGEVVAAPLPGNVLKINVQAGSAVKSGEILLLIEAMKMENEVVAPRDGVVKQVCVASGKTVNTGDALIVLE
ncbi:MAG: biotin/lipoyl-binding protein [Oscillospiraceae bacterium]|nr:biotin/lipoyl-binding protein [Oscillospiraceae bacterium]